MTDAVIEIREPQEVVIIEVAQGIFGPVGPRGEIGPQGLAGADGSDGTDGAPGPQGEKGDKGDQGDPGDPGTPGATGATGPQGPAGPAGATGAQGPQGPQGLTGPQGQQGPQGPQGPQGLDGPPGIPGAPGASDWASIANKPTIYSEFVIWAEENSDIADNSYEWAFGNGANTGSDEGITLPFACELFALSLTTKGVASCEVEVRRNAASAGVSVTTSNSRSGYTSFAATPVAYAAGDRVTFRTVIGSTSSDAAVVSAWFRRAVA